jgi:hypothetical protein
MVMKTLVGHEQIESTVTGKPPIVVASSEKVTNLNADWVDGVGLGSMSTGGAVYASSASNIQSTAAGTSGQVLTSNGAGAPTWTSSPSFGGPVTILSNSASTALTVTNTGAGNSFVVEDSASTDSSPFVIDSAGSVIAGHTAQIAGSVTPKAQIIGPTTSGSLGLYSYSAGGGGPTLEMGYANNATIGINTVVASGDSLGVIRFSGADGTNIIRAAQIVAQVDGTPGINDMPGRLVFSTTADGASSPTEALRINSSQGLGTGGLTAATVGFYQGKVITGGTTAWSNLNISTVQSDVTSNAYYYQSSARTAVASFTVANLHHYNATQGTFGAGSVVTSQYGHTADSTIIGATTNIGFYAGNTAAVTAGKAAYGFRSDVNIATGGGTTYQLYMSGTATNYINGLVDISGASAGQIKFPATQNASADANTLDDYEEGTFTPAITLGGAAVGVTYSLQSGTYTKIGNRVLFTAQITLSAKGSSAGALLITGLPFTVGGTLNPASAVRVSSVTSGVGDTLVTGQSLTASSTVRLEKIVAGLATQLTDADVSATTTVSITGNYIV